VVSERGSVEPRPIRERARRRGTGFGTPPAAAPATHLVPEANPNGPPPRAGTASPQAKSPRRIAPCARRCTPLHRPLSPRVTSVPGSLPPQFDWRSPSRRSPGVTSKLAEMARRVDVAHEYTGVARRLRVEQVTAQVAMVKNTAVEACALVVDQAVQIRGGLGYMREAEVERRRPHPRHRRRHDRDHERGDRRPPGPLKGCWGRRASPRCPRRFRGGRQGMRTTSPGTM
jgi:Acyl-CoA dehydrogenase, C-terminal domain